MPVVKDPCICTTCPIMCNFCTEPIARNCPVQGATKLVSPTPDKIAKLALSTNYVYVEKL